MKFALKIRKFYIISILTALTVSGINSQQFSYVNNNHVFSVNRYTFPKYLGIEKTYSISQNNLGIVFFSTNKGIITFDGRDWGVLNFNKKSIITLCSNKLYLFSDNYTGEIFKDSSGSYSIRDIKVEHPLKNWAPVDVACSGDSIYVVSNEKLWIFRNNSFQFLYDTNEEAYLFSDENNVYLDKNNTVFRLKDGKILDIADSIKTNSDVKYFDGYIFSPVFYLNDNLVLYTKPPGTGKIHVPIKDSVVTTFPDRNNNLWVLSENALYCLKYAEYFNHFGSISSLKSPLKETAKNTGGIFLADNNNIFTPDLKSHPVPEGNILHIFSIENRILFTTKDGIYQFQDKGNTKLVSLPISYISKFQNKLLFVSEGKLFSLNFINDLVSVKELYNLNIDSVQNIITTKNGDLLLLDKQNRIHLLKAKINGIFKTLYTPKNNNLPQLENIFQISNEIYVYNSLNIYQLEKNNLVSQEKSHFNFPSQGHFIEYLQEDTTGGILYSTCSPGESKHIYYGRNTGDSQLNWLEIPIWEAGLKDPEILSSSGKEVVLFENGDLIHLDLNKFLGRVDKVIITINEVTVNNKNVLIKQQKKGQEMVHFFEAHYPINLISLKFSASDLTYPEHVQYSFMVMDKDAEWSPWARLPEKNFSNLPPGDYKLLVKAQSINGSVSDIFTLRFKILAPFYIKWYAWMIYVILFLGLIGVLAFRRKKQFEKEKQKLENIIQERTSELTKEKEKTDDLLANLLPKDTADELKNTGKATSHKFDMVTVLFSDIQGFTKIAEHMNPEKLIDELDNFFFQFDSVVEKYNIEKIKTIGDAYMAAGGIPYKNRTNPVEVVLAALEMQEFMKTLKVKNSDIWDLRIGIHTGAVIAGVIGHKRISYDIWGDTVNTASRMESSGEASKINISGYTYELVKEFYICEYRGKMPVKYKGDIDMYFVKGIRPELSIDLRSIPNNHFFIQLQLLRILDLEEYVFNKLEAELPEQLTFHNLKHTKDVCTQAELLGRAENITSEEMLLLRTAALFHDTGFIWNYYDHESKSIEFCREVLPKYKYSAMQIDSICKLILCTKKNVLPQSKIEELLIDSNNVYLGRIDFVSILMNLMSEIKSYNFNSSEEDFLNDQVNRLENHEFYTHAARKLREVPKSEQIQKIKDHLKQFA